MWLSKIWHQHRPRWLHRIYAHLTGRFWLPCPMCGRYFGGHECASEHNAIIWRDSGGNERVCWRCGWEACEKNPHPDIVLRDPGSWNAAKKLLDSAHESTGIGITLDGDAIVRGAYARGQF